MNSNGPAIIGIRREFGAWEAAHFTNITRTPRREFSTPSTYQGRITPNTLDTWAQTLEILDLEDPTEASTLWAKAKEAASARPTDTAQTGDAAARFARGDIDVQALASEAATAGQEHQYLATGAKSATEELKKVALQMQTAAYRALYEAGDSLVTDLLAPKVQEILTAASKKNTGTDTLNHLTDQWKAAHEIARLLRGHILPSVDGTVSEHAYARPDLQELWVLENSSEIKVRDYAKAEKRDGTTYVKFIPSAGSPRVDMRVIAEHADEWGPGLYTAAQVVENSQTWEQAI